MISSKKTSRIISGKMNAIQETRNPMNTIERYTMIYAIHKIQVSFSNIFAKKPQLQNMAPLPVHATIFKEETHPSLPKCQLSARGTGSSPCFFQCLDVIDPAGGSELIGIEDERCQHPRHSHLMFWMMFIHPES